MDGRSPRTLYRDSPLTLDQELVRAAGDGARRQVFHLQDGDVEVTPQQLVTFARRGAGALRSWGVRAGDTVGVLGPNRPEWAQWAFAAWAAGAVLVPLGFPLRVRDRDALARHVLRSTEAARCRVVLAHPMFISMFSLGAGIVPWDRSHPDAEPPRAERTGVTVDDPAVIQFTSGSTAAPKGVVLTHRQVLGQVWGLDGYYGSDRESDRFISWLPLFHDNGLFLHLVTPLLLQSENHIVPTERFARNPAIWFRLASEVGATITSGPPSAWAVAMRAAVRRPDGIDLSRLQIGVLTAEMILPEVVDRLAEDGKSIGLRPEALAAGYGMAEATLAATISRRGGGIRFDNVSIDELASRLAVSSPDRPSKRVASCGPPMPGIEVRVWRPRGCAREREVGEVQLRGASIMRGYLGERVTQPFMDGWLRTGDLGYLLDGELFLTGRIKDIIIVGGRNYAPEDIEWVVGQIAGVRPGRCIAFAPPGVDGELLIALEPSNDADADALPDVVRQAILNAMGIPVRDVLIVPKGSIPFTTSGKLQRSAVRDAYARGSLDLAGSLRV